MKITLDEIYLLRIHLKKVNILYVLAYSVKKLLIRKQIFVIMNLIGINWIHRICFYNFISKYMFGA